MSGFTRTERLLDAIATGEDSEVIPMTREERYLAYISGETDTIPPKACTRKERLLAKIAEKGVGGGSGGGTSEGVNLSYTLNKDGTYSSKSASKDSVFPSGSWYSKFIYVSDKTYTIEELVGHTIRVKEIDVPTGVIDEVRDIEITRDMITDIGNGTFAIIDSVSELPILGVITEGMTGIDISGDGFILPSNAGTYLVYADKSPDKKGYVFGSVSVKKTLGKPYIDTSGMTNFHAFFENGARMEYFNVVDTSNGTDFTYMFNSNKEFVVLPVIDTSNGRKFDCMFQGATTIKDIPYLDISSGTTFAYMCSKCSSLETITLTAPKYDLASGTFQSCMALKNVTLAKGWAVSFYLMRSDDLTVESLHGMIENLADLTGKTVKKFRIGETNLAKIDEEHIAMLNAKNWEYS